MKIFLAATFMIASSSSVYAAEMQTTAKSVSNMTSHALIHSSLLPDSALKKDSPVKNQTDEFATKAGIPLSSKEALKQLQGKYKRGNEGGGGGDTIQTSEGKRGLLDLQEVDDLTDFNFDLKNYSPEIDRMYKKEILGCDADNYFNMCGHNNDPTDKIELTGLFFIRSGQIKLHPIFAQVVAACGGNIAALYTEGTRWLFPVKALQWVFTDVVLEDIKDEGYIRVINPETKRQVAIQIDGLVIVNRAEFKSMNEENKAALKLHEDVLCATLAFNPALIEKEGTESVRLFVRKFVKYVNTHNKPEGMTAQAVANASRVLFPDTVTKVYTQLKSEGKVSNGKLGVRCDYYLQSGKQSKPNVLAECYIEGFFDGYGRMITRKYEIAPMKIEPISLDANGYYEKEKQEMMNHSRAFIQKNLNVLMQKWQEYLRL